jgi:hypothetical protein
MSEKAWEDFVGFMEAIRRDGLVEKLGDSHIFMSLVPEKPDIKAAVELGLAIFFDKPIISVVMPGREISEHLARVSDKIVYADIDTEEGREKLTSEIKGMFESI